MFEAETRTKVEDLVKTKIKEAMEKRRVSTAETTTTFGLVDVTDEVADAKAPVN